MAPRRKAKRPTNRHGERAAAGAPPRVVYREFRPHELLREDVRCFWVLDMEYPKDGVQDVVPDGCVELIFNFGSPYRPLTGRVVEPPPVGFVVGFQDKTVKFRVSGRVRVVAARMQAWGALTLLRDRIEGLAGAVTGLGEEWRGTIARIGACVARDDREGAVRVLEGLLIERSLARRYDRDLIQAAASHLHRTKGRFKIGELADSCRLSVRQLERGFRRVVGATPKTYARTLRFERAQRRLMFEPEADLTELANECGYFDQAHFIKDFKAFTGTTPSRYAREMARMQRILRAKDVVFLQFAAPTAG